MTEDRDVLLPREGHLPEGKTSNSRGTPERRSNRRRQVLQKVQETPRAEIEETGWYTRRSKQTLSSLHPFPMTAHSHPRTSPGAPGTMEHRKEELTLPPPAPLAPLLLTEGLAQVGERERGEKERDEGGVLRGGESSIPASPHPTETLKRLS